MYQPIRHSSLPYYQVGEYRGGRLRLEQRQRGNQCEYSLRVGAPRDTRPRVNYLPAVVICVLFLGIGCGKSLDSGDCDPYACDCTQADLFCRNRQCVAEYGSCF